MSRRARWWLAAVSREHVTRDDRGDPAAWWDLRKPQLHGQLRLALALGAVDGSHHAQHLDAAVTLRNRVVK